MLRSCVPHNILLDYVNLTAENGGGMLNGLLVLHKATNRDDFPGPGKCDL